jgi:hypothetical protein
MLCAALTLTTAGLSAQEPPPAPTAPEAAPAPRAMPARSVRSASGGGGGSMNVNIDAATAKAASYQDRLQSVVRRIGGGDSRSALVASTAPSSEDRAALEEDMAIMSRLLGRAVEGSGSPADRAMGIVVKGLPGNRLPQNLYLEGYGALFLLDVPMPLMGDDEKASSKTETKKTDTEWEKARREIQGGRDPFAGLVAPEMVYFGGEPVAYDSAKVTELKKRLIDALKNAGNIRMLKAGENVTVLVSGSPVGSGRKSRVDESREDADIRRFEVRVEASEKSARQNTTMSLTVKKADAEAFADGKMEADAFAARVKVAVY